MNHVASNLSALRAIIPPHVTLVAVSKTQTKEAILQALDAGQRVFGENRVQEAAMHWADLRASYPDLRLHLIGGLQTNKAAEAVALFDVIESVDRARLVDVLAAEMQKQQRRLPCLIQVNTGGEEQKNGISVADAPALLAYARERGLNITGLMCIPPIEDNPAPHFDQLAKMAGAMGLATLSMGMSSDFSLAIAHGATHVRVGSALFGARQRST